MRVTKNLIRTCKNCGCDFTRRCEHCSTSHSRETHRRRSGNIKASGGGRREAASAGRYQTQTSRVIPKAPTSSRPSEHARDDIEILRKKWIKKNPKDLSRKELLKKWQEVGLPVITQAKLLGISRQSIYGRRTRYSKLSRCKQCEEPRTIKAARLCRTCYAQNAKPVINRELYPKPTCLPRICKKCKQKKPHCAKDMCRCCYSRSCTRKMNGSNRNPRQCYLCKSIRQISGFGLCGRCYYMHYRQKRDTEKKAAIEKHIQDFQTEFYQLPLMTFENLLNFLYKWLSRLHITIKSGGTLLEKSTLKPLLQIPIAFDKTDSLYQLTGGRNTKPYSCPVSHIIQIHPKRIKGTSIQRALEIRKAQMVIGVNLTKMIQSTREKSERISSGIAAAGANGVVLGRPKNDKRREQVQRLKSEGMSVQQIANKIGCSRQNCYRFLNTQQPRSGDSE